MNADKKNLVERGRHTIYRIVQVKSSLLSYVRHGCPVARARGSCLKRKTIELSDCSCHHYVVGDSLEKRCSEKEIRYMTCIVINIDYYHTMIYINCQKVVCFDCTITTPISDSCHFSLPEYWLVMNDLFVSRYLTGFYSCPKEAWWSKTRTNRCWSRYWYVNICSNLDLQYKGSKTSIYMYVSAHWAGNLFIFTCWMGLGPSKFSVLN